MGNSQWANQIRLHLLAFSGSGGQWWRASWCRSNSEFGKEWGRGKGEGEREAAVHFSRLDDERSSAVSAVCRAKCVFPLVYFFICPFTYALLRSLSIQGYIQRNRVSKYCPIPIIFSPDGEPARKLKLKTASNNSNRGNTRGGQGEMAKSQMPICPFTGYCSFSILASEQIRHPAKI